MRVKIFKWYILSEEELEKISLDKLKAKGMHVAKNPKKGGPKAKKEVVG